MAKIFCGWCLEDWIGLSDFGMLSTVPFVERIEWSGDVCKMALEMFSLVAWNGTEYFDSVKLIYLKLAMRVARRDGACGFSILVPSLMARARHSLLSLVVQRACTTARDNYCSA